MKKTFSLRTKIIFLMTLLLILQNIALIMSISSSKIFYMLDAESFRLFNNTASSRMQTLNKEIGKVISNASEDAKLLSSKINNYLTMVSEDTIASLNYEDDLSAIGTENLLHLLQNNSISGAFFILQPSASKKDISVYLRNPAGQNLNTAHSLYRLEIGSEKIADFFHLPKSDFWQPNFQMSIDEHKKQDYYHQPVSASYQNHGEKMSFGYWSVKTNLLPHLAPAFYYTLPLLDSKRIPIGIIGIEISYSHFSQHFLPKNVLFYDDSFYIIGDLKDNVLSLDWFVTGRHIANIYLPEGNSLPFTPTVIAKNIYETNLAGLGDVYCFVHPIRIYPADSPFSSRLWSLVSFIPKQTLHEGAFNVQKTLAISLGLTSLLTFVALLFLAFVSTRRISSLSKYVTGLNPYQELHLTRTGMREIDDLSIAVETLNRRVIESSKTTSKILELSLLPIGGYEINSSLNRVSITEYICHLLDIPNTSQLSTEEWEVYYKELTANPESDYENIYRFLPKADLVHVWLRILENDDENGKVGVVLDVTKEIEEHQRLLHELDFDSMTHLYNRKAFKREVNQKILTYPNQVGIMIFSDLDNLKYINDTFGHETGDRLVLRASEMFGQFSSLGGIVSRISGDEFAIYLHGYSSKEEAMQVIREQFKKFELYSLKTPDGVSHRIRSSSGLAWYPEHSTNVTDLLKLSDFAMYEAKHNQKGVLYEFNPEAYKSKAFLLDNREAIHRLIDERLIHFHYQPIVCLKTGNLYAYECLMRSSMSEFKTPSEILTVATSQSQLAQLERLVFQVAFESIAKRIEEIGEAQIFINSIPSHLLTFKEFQAFKRTYRSFFSQVVIEVTERESNTLQNFNERLNSLRKLGLRFAIDDFGNGYSSEVRFLSVNPDILKIDRMLIHGIAEDSDKQKLVANLISFCHSKNIMLIAEGVENKSDLNQIIAMGVDFVQGFYIGKPTLEIEKISPKIKAEILYLQEKNRK